MTELKVGDAVTTRSGLVYTIEDLRPYLGEMNYHLAPLTYSRPGRVNWALGATGNIRATVKWCQLIRSAELMAAYVNIKEGDDDGAFRMIVKAEQRGADGAAEMAQIRGHLARIRTFGIEGLTHDR